MHPIPVNDTTDLIFDIIRVLTILMGAYIITAMYLIRNPEWGVVLKMMWRFQVATLFVTEFGFIERIVTDSPPSVTAILAFMLFIGGTLTLGYVHREKYMWKKNHPQFEAWLKEQDNYAGGKWRRDHDEPAD